MVQLLEAEDDTLTANIRNSPILISAIRELASSAPPSQRGGGAQHETSGGGSDEEFEDDGLEADGDGEIASLARRILDLTEDGREGDGLAPGSGNDGDAAGNQGSEHAALRASVRQALAKQQ